jgi:hypothetical protein
MCLPFYLKPAVQDVSFFCPALIGQALIDTHKLEGWQLICTFSGRFFLTLF